MSTVEKIMNEITSLSEKQVEQVYSFTMFLKTMPGAFEDSKSISGKYRTAGGLDGEFWMADDFDETPDCFKEYM